MACITLTTDFGTALWPKSGPETSPGASLAQNFVANKMHEAGLCLRWKLFRSTQGSRPELV